MATRFIVNGNEYASVEEMPADVRQVYDAALERLADDNKNGVPDILEANVPGKVVAVQHSEVSVNGKSFAAGAGMPDWARRLLENAVARTAEKGARSPNEGLTTGFTESPAAPDRPSFSFPWEDELSRARPARDHDGLLATLDRVAWTLGKVLQGIVLAGAIAVLVGGVWIIQNLDAGSKAQGGVFYIGAGILLAEGWLIKTYFSIRRRD